ncbi:hypothetical protein F4804DRAFT_351885 [Jackrogersella minutella]|nr:hypothetical protein F4804DRAFT_351885 [Jackrogersella minutella]
MANDDDNTQVYLPLIPKLTGENNLKQWKRFIRNHINYYGLNAFFDGTAKEPTGGDEATKLKFRQNRIHALILVTSSISQEVEEQLEAAGWKDDESDPQVLWDLILVTMSKVSASSVPKLFYELMSSKLEPGVTLHTFNSNFHKIANRLTELDVPLPPKAKLLLFLKAIKDRYPKWHSSLERDFEKGTLTWEDFKNEVIWKANIEENKQDGTAHFSRKKGSNKDKDKIPRINCTLCKKSHLANWPYCSGCSKHHPGGEPKCYRLHPELRPSQNTLAQGATAPAPAPFPAPQPDQAMVAKRTQFVSSFFSIETGL